ncbi:MAG: SDR family oxidoreductase [Chloroflexi bacterium]|nr:SDR family oxidoreductase [Chloroflexota bacterium]
MPEGKGRIPNLTDKVALVTGGGSGFGRNFCLALAEAGADIVCSDLFQERADETCAMLEKYGRKSLSLGVDITRYPQVCEAFRKTKDTFSKLDILINNAGVTSRSTLIGDVDIAEWHRVIDVDLHGTFYCLKEGLRIMAAQKSGAIVNIASIIGITGVEHSINALAPYGAAKAGVIWLTKQAAVEYGRYGIRVNCIAPGWHKGTRLAMDAGVKRTSEELQDWEQKVIKRTPLGRRGEADELNALVLYLASDDSSFVTGQTIAHDGGWTCL